MKKIKEEFKTFIARGNVIDLAVGVVVGGAFKQIVDSLVNDLIMPIVGIIIGGTDFSGLSIDVGDATIKYGLFIQNTINFFIIAFCIFLMIKIINKLTDKKKTPVANATTAPNAPAAPSETKDTELLKEIRDLLKKQAGK